MEMQGSSCPARHGDVSLPLKWMSKTTKNPIFSLSPLFFLSIPVLLPLGRPLMKSKFVQCDVVRAFLSRLSVLPALFICTFIFYCDCTQGGDLCGTWGPEMEFS